MPTNKRPHSVTEGNMDEKDIGFSIAKWLSENANTLFASGIAVVIRFLSIAYDYSNGGPRRTWLATFTESFLCGAITLSMSSGLELFGIPTTAATMVGGGIGFVGVEKLRQFADTWLNKRKKPDHEAI